MFSADQPPELAVAIADVQLNGAYEPINDVLYLSSVHDDKDAPAHQTPEGHTVRLDDQGRITHLTAINAEQLLERDGVLIATLPDGRRLSLTREDVGDDSD